MICSTGRRVEIEWERKESSGARANFWHGYGDFFFGGREGRGGEAVYCGMEIVGNAFPFLPSKVVECKIMGAERGGRGDRTTSKGEGQRKSWCGVGGLLRPYCGTLSENSYKKPCFIEENLLQKRSSFFFRSFAFLAPTCLKSRS